MATPAADLPSDLLEHAAFARRLARALVADAALADDVVQQSFVRALERPPRGGASLRGWLAVVVRRTASKILRGRRRAAANDERFAATRSETLPATVDVAAQLDAQRALLDAVARLDPIYRDALHERYFADRTPTEIARAADVSPRTIETRLRRGLERLRETLMRQAGGSASAWIVSLGHLLDPSVRIGVPLMKTATKVKLAAAALVVVTAGGVGVALRRGAGDHDVAARDRMADAVTATAPPVAAERVEVAAGPATTVAATAQLRLLLPDATPARSAWIAVLAGTKVVANGKTKEDGLFAWSEPDAPTRFVAWTPEAPPQWAEADALRGPDDSKSSASVGANAWSWTLADGIALTGRVFVDGAAPTKPIRLMFRTQSRIGLPAELYACVQGLSSHPLDAMSEFVATTDAVGCFRCFGLDAATSGFLEAPSDLEWDGPAPRIDGLPRNVEVRLRSRPIWKGRLVDDHGAAVAGYAIRFSSHRGDPENAASNVAHVTATWTKSDADGRFQFSLTSAREIYVQAVPLPDVVHAPTLFVSDPGETFRGAIDFDGDRPRNLDLGDLPLPPARELTVTLRDETGAPIPTAQFELRERDFTDLSGWRAGWLHAQFPAQGAVTRVTVARASRHLRVLAAGHLPKCVVLREGEATTSIVVELPRTSELVLRAEGPDHAVATGVRFELRSAEWPYAGDALDSYALESAFGHRYRRWLTWNEDGGVSQSTLPDEKGEWRLAGLRAGLPLTVIARDELGAEIRREIVTFAVGERREVVVRCEQAEPLAGRVVDESDHPVRMAELFFVAPGSMLEDGAPPPAQVGTKADGTFQLPALVATNGELVVVADGFAEARVAVEVGADEAPIEVKLHRTRSLYISLAGVMSDGEPNPDPDSAGVDGWVTRPSAVRESESATRPADGGLGRLVDRRQQRLRFDELPSGPLVVHLRVNGTTISAPIPVDKDQVGMMLSVPTEVDVHLALTDATYRAGQRLREIRLVAADASICARKIEARSIPPYEIDERFAAVPVGRHRLELVWWSVPHQALEVETTDVEVDVVAGRRSRVTVTR